MNSSSSDMTPPYVRGIAQQVHTLRAILDAPIPDDVGRLVRDRLARYNGIVFTGMGSGPFASYPAWLRLVSAGVPAWVVETAELINYAPGLLTPDKLLVVVSQSGESAEVLALLDTLGPKRPTILAVVNNLSSPLARAADVVYPLHVGAAREDTAGTGTYINTIVAGARLVDAALGEDHSADFAPAVSEVRRYVEALDDHLDIARPLELASRTFVVLGRGPSLASARTGALLVKEAGKVHAEALAASEFRHGPLDLVDDRFTAVMLAGARATASLNRRMAQDILDRDGQVLWVGPGEGPGVNLAAPTLTGAARPIAEILPLQMLSVASALDNGLQPGAFRHASRVTRVL
ncbi:SIS domain-containing protein [Streptosporangium sp. NPDC049046]|uniref:SIS domain-containing protein n=1 Tax=Streptosporangium sp. NPDC049046 TaxID=3155031 RepID=UPI0034297075